MRDIDWFEVAASLSRQGNDLGKQGLAAKVEKIGETASLAKHAIDHSRHKSTCWSYGGHDCNCGLDELRAECRRMLGAEDRS